MCCYDTLLTIRTDERRVLQEKKSYQQKVKGTTFIYLILEYLVAKNIGRCCKV